MKRFLKFLGLALALAVLVAPATAQVNPAYVVIVPSSGAISVSTGVTAVDTAPAMLVKFVGTPLAAGAATLAVTTDDFIFTTDGTTADATINVQATTPCGATPGTLDTGDADCNLVGELLNEINASPNWVAIPIGALATDNAAAYFKDLAETSTDADGIVVFNDSATTLQTTNAFLPPQVDGNHNVLDIRSFLNGGTLKANAWLDWRSSMDWYIQNFVGDAAAGAIYAVRGTFSTGKVYTETVRVVFSFTGAATGVDKELTQLRNGPLLVNPGEHLVFRGASGTTHTSPVQRATGFVIAK